MTAYVVMVRTRMRDQSAFAEYARLAPKVQCEEFPEIVAFYGKHVDVEGAAADGVVILRGGGRPLHAYAGDWLVYTPGGFVVAPPRIAEGLFEPRPATALLTDSMSRDATRRHETPS